MACNCIGGNPCPCQRGRFIGQITFGPNYPFTTVIPQTFSWGVYKCKRCEKAYTVNDQWKQCTPDFCHDCYEHICKQFALVPVDKDGKDVPQ